MKQEPAKKGESVEIESSLKSTEADVYAHREQWIKGGEIKSISDLTVYNGMDAHLLKRVDWIEIPAQKEVLDRLEKSQRLLEWEFLPKVLAYWVKDNMLTIITETRGSALLRPLLSRKPIELPSSFLCSVSKKILQAAVSMESAQVKGKVCIDNISITEEGSVYIHNDSVWKEILGMAIMDVQTEEERAREIGIALLSLGAGEILEGLPMFSNIDMGDESAQYKILEQIIKIRIPCFKEVVVGLLGSPYTPHLLEEILAMHFFYPEDEQEIEPCRCASADYLDEEDGEDIYYKETVFGHGQKKTEEIYDHDAGVAVKASTLDRNKFTFQMHFFKSSKKVSFCFNRNADTVDSVMKEMEDEGLAEENEIGLIKAHMENLIIKIDENKSDDESRSQEDEGHALPNSDSVELPIKETQDALAAVPSSTPSDASEDSSDYSMKEFKDSQQISEFVFEVAACVKRAKGTAEGWIVLLRKQDIKTVGDLRMLTEEDWEMLKLPVFASRAMKNILYGESYTPYKEKMLGIDEEMKEYLNESTVEDLLLETAQKHGRPELFSVWLQKVKCQDIRTVGELKLLREEDWEQLGLSVFSYRAIRNAMFRHYKCLHAY
ncbi:hypothetical protein NEMIN01_1648 [Nematocida minor]|uniref:uncharacterized protein n=1 Tax=Nematocida minor TaxID=1912983 RepID=UPI002220626D|nr:uncharacterized protein NEMIN01_1648 [Nematocida minor]KAI5191757.1 hypothetical protein NEMIN01_1648 [Nematocida minor]